MYTILWLLSDGKLPRLVELPLQAIVVVFLFDLLIGYLSYKVSKK